MNSRLPPGPRLPRVVQTAGFVIRALRFQEWARARYGDVVTFNTLFQGPFVMVFDPALVREVFQGSGEQLHAGEANAVLGPIVGERSVLLLDGREHLRHRRLLLPPFHGRALASYQRAIIEATDAEIDGWPVGRPFPLLPSMQALTLRVILQVVFGYAPGEATELARRLRAFIDPLSEPRSIRSVLRLLRNRVGGSTGGASPFQQRRDAVDELLFAEIARRRGLGAERLSDRGDVFSMLLLASDEAGGRLSDREVRDELMTLLIAGHETTANGLAWTFDLLLHDPEVLARTRGGDDAYLDAVVKEALRLRPVLGLVGRVVRGEPFSLGGYSIPPGVEINPSIRVIQRRGDLYPEPRRFRPERFLGPAAPDTYTWIPFGGGTRRCLGAAFAAFEMRVVIRRILERTELRPASPRHERVQLHIITLAPRNGTEVVIDAPPSPASAPTHVADRESPAAAPQE